MMDQDELRTSEEWNKDDGIVILDADGWDRKNFKFSWFEERINRDEYNRRISISTIQLKSWKNC
jgi:hypothetical protein